MGGRITKEDVKDHMNKAEQYELQKVKQGGSKKEIGQNKASNFCSSQNTAAILTTLNEIVMKIVMDLRAKYKETFEKNEMKLGIKGRSSNIERDS